VNNVAKKLNLSINAVFAGTTSVRNTYSQKITIVLKING
jgi:hypothetical protein